MEEQGIIELALENLEKQTLIKGKWDNREHRETRTGFTADGKLTLFVDNHEIKYNAEIKREIRSNNLQKLIDYNNSLNPFILVAYHLFPKIKEELRKNNIAYLEANGNICLQGKGLTLWVDTNKPITAAKETPNRAFTKTGLKVVFIFLLEEAWVNRPYRQIAEKTGTGVGNVTNIINALKKEGFIIRVNNKEYALQHKKQLLEKWVTAYGEKLKPALQKGVFRFLKEEDFINWKNLRLVPAKTWWGGEPAGDLFTGHLRPEELTLYTTETRNELIRHYRLIPDDKGHVKVYEKFWNEGQVNDHVVPPLLAYADLINTGDRRCMETAQKIYNELLQDKL